MGRSTDNDYYGYSLNHTGLNKSRPYQQPTSNFDPDDRKGIVYRLLCLKQQGLQFSSDLVDLICSQSKNWEEIKKQAVRDFGSKFSHFEWNKKSPIAESLNFSGRRNNHQNVAQAADFNVLLQALLSQ